MSKQNIVVLSGAGISAESGLKTFRDADGLWEGHDVMEVATPEGWRNNQELVLRFYNDRRRQLLEVTPNAAHKDLVKLEEDYDVTIITQNVDDLHERAGSSNVIHLHGELLKVRSSKDESDIKPWTTDLKKGDLCALGFQLRPHIVWFGEEVPLLDKAAELVNKADFIIIVGTSMQVYPAAGLIDFAKPSAQIYFIDPKPSIAQIERLTIVPEIASTGIKKVVTSLLH
ncbi:NAD-dependent deacylase [uncultured Dokdonia sp.]|uniref:SIR2 family NAD-dependent protein deacylase n=1 Tax=uncultured Dokdonia sp. TaxID=575653 RepID=UPI0030EE6D51|tara:strand:+ start:103556 stop:104239 length:684 start_codon:yes stop_codon:yes gene_type:complete